MWLDNVDCSGNETSLSQCGHKGWGVDNCSGSENVGITCYGINYYNCDSCENIYFRIEGEGDGCSACTCPSDQ